MGMRGLGVEVGRDEGTMEERDEGTRGGGGEG